jgi:predicted ATPase
MFNSIHLQQFFSFHDTRISCNRGVNLLVGINGSGKSNFIKAMRVAREVAAGTGLKRLILDQWGGFDNIFHYGYEATSVVLSFEIDHQVASEYGYYFSHAVFYDLTIHKIPNTANYYLSEKLYQPQPGRSQPFILLNFSNGQGVLLEKSDASDRKKTHLIRYNDFDGQESVIGKIYDSDRYQALNAIRRMLNDITVYDYFDTTPGSRIRKPILPSSETKLLPDGSNLAQVLNLLKIQDKATDRTIRDALNRINPAFRDYDFNFIGGNIELMLSEQGLNRSVHTTHISDGTLRFLCLLAILLNPKRGRLVCIDEPEVGLHPDMLLGVSETIEQAGQTSQVFVATHSEHILNQFSIPDIKVLEKDAKNSTTVKAYEESDFEGWYDNFMAGNMWRAGDFGGNRY